VLHSQRDDTIAGSPQFIYEFSLSRLTESGQNDLVNGFPVVSAFVADINQLSSTKIGGRARTDIDPLRDDTFETVLQASLAG
jgi:hypothetical protein